MYATVVTSFAILYYDGMNLTQNYLTFGRASVNVLKYMEPFEWICVTIYHYINQYQQIKSNRFSSSLTVGRPKICPYHCVRHQRVRRVMDSISIKVYTTDKGL